jgi:hypothetical protein
MTQANEEAFKSMQHVMKHCIETPNQGLLLALTGVLDIKGISDTTYASDYDTWQSVMGRTTFLNDAPVIMKSNMQHITNLSVTESELGGATETAQDMLFVMQILESKELKVTKPMILYIDSKGAKDLANNWSVGGQTRHIEVQQYFLCELKEQGLIVCVGTAGNGMCSNLFTKNLLCQLFKKHASAFVGYNEYMLPTDDYIDNMENFNKNKKKNEVGNIHIEKGVGLQFILLWYLDDFAHWL